MIEDDDDGTVTAIGEDEAGVTTVTVGDDVDEEDVVGELLVDAVSHDDDDVIPFTAAKRFTVESSEAAVLISAVND